jgi:ribose transport system substrate-binding protein
MSRTLPRPLTIAAITASLALASIGSTVTVNAQGDDATASCIAAATAAVEEGRQPLEVLAPPSSIDVGRLAESSVWLIAAGQTEFTQTVADGFEAAGDAAGIDTRYVEAGFAVNQMQQLVEQAVAANADGIVLFNITPGSVSGPLEKAIEAGIPIMDFNNGDPTDPLEPGIFAHVAAEFSIDGQKKAAWLLADSGCELNLATFNVPTLNVVDLMINGVIDEVNRLCPETCSITESDFQLSDFATSLGPLVQTVIRRDPSITYIDPAADAFASVISPVLQLAGTEVKILGHDGNPSTIATLAAGNSLQAMTIAGPPEVFIGWALLDQLSRGMLGEEAADWGLPGRIVDATNIGSGSDEDIHPGWEGFEAKFLEAWGL